MKRTNKSAVLLLLALALSACSDTLIQTVEVTRVVPQTVVVTEAVQETATPVSVGGFTTGTPVDVSTLPALMEVPGGGEPVSCFVNSSEPSINWGYDVFPNRMLCLNNFPTAPDSPGFTITLTDPIGHTFQESFTYYQGDILDSKGANAGWVQQGGNSDIDPATPGVNVEVYMPASFTCGDWHVSAKTQDGRISTGPTPLTVDCSSPLTSVLPNLSIDPFVSRGYAWEGPAFTNTETLYVVGAAYPPNTAIMVALYQVDPSAGMSEMGLPLGTAKYAVSVTTDSSGNLQAPFVVGSATQGGPYYAIAAPVIMFDTMRLHVFGARFSIK